MENTGRKKHMVEGKVAEIKKQEEGLKNENGPVGQRKEGFFASLFKGRAPKEK